jgi:hypothetical protein
MIGQPGCFGPTFRLMHRSKAVGERYLLDFFTYPSAVRCAHLRSHDVVRLEQDRASSTKARSGHRLALAES